MGSLDAALSVGDALRREVQKSIEEMRKYRERKEHTLLKCHRCRCQMFAEDAIRVEYKRYGITTRYNICVMCARRGKRNIGSGTLQY